MCLYEIFYYRHIRIHMNNSFINLKKHILKNIGTTI